MVNASKGKPDQICFFIFWAIALWGMAVKLINYTNTQSESWFQQFLVEINTPPHLLLRGAFWAPSKW